MGATEKNQIFPGIFIANLAIYPAMTDRGHEYNDLIERLRSMDPYEFEKLVGALWEQQGYEIDVRPASRDRGIDIVARKADPFPRKQLLQIKRYNESNKIGSRVVRQYRTLYDQDREASIVAIITTSDFSREARRLANDLQVELVDGVQLCDLLFQHAPQLSKEFFETEDDRLGDPEENDETQDQGTKYGHLISREDTVGRDGEKKPSSKGTSQSDAQPDNPKETPSSKTESPVGGKSDIVDRYSHIIEDLDSET